MLHVLGILIVLAILVVLVLALLQPKRFRVQRSIVINVTPDKVAPLIQDFHQWPQWSPWAHIDPNMKTVYSGAESGVGAVYEWDGNSKVGTGRMEIVASDSTKTTLQLDFFKPFEAHNTAEFLVEPQGIAATHVTWTMSGPNKFFPGMLMGVFGLMDKMIGRDFEKGLINMKAVAERE